MANVKKSRYGVYYDLSVSPYEYTTPYGDIFKFRSKKKLEIYTRDAPKEVERMDNLIERNNMGGFIPEDIVRLLHRATYKALYKRIEG